VSPSPVTDGRKRGFIIPIGGAEEKINDPHILEKFVDLSGGEDARIVIIPTASQLEDTGARYEKVFKELNVASARSFTFNSREDCQSPDWQPAFAEATGIFMTGGNQLRLSTILGGTPVAQTIRRRNAAGVHVAGTSAGAGFVSEHMIAFGGEGLFPRGQLATIVPGLGLTNKVIVDHHFQQRARLGRLLTVLGYNPFAFGVGLDEDTAAFIGPDDVLHCVGSRSLTLVDPSGIQYSSLETAREGESVCIVGIGLHFLADGWGFDLVKRSAVPPPLETPDGD